MAPKKSQPTRQEPKPVSPSSIPTSPFPFNLITPDLTELMPLIQKADQVDEAPLQAVLLADSYNRRFEVLCLDQPRVLLPLCSTPLLAWTLESLSLSKVKQVFIFCGAHADKIRDFVA